MTADARWRAGEGPLDAFAARFPFALDRFQREGIAALVDGRSVLVAAPTGAGKTVVGEFAVWYALQRGGKAFYTTPIKALSNQKHADLVRAHGAGNVGLLTGDRAVNGDAPIVVMTTEVLRNMLYEGSPTLAGLHFVVLDEVHYLADAERGAVWEEVIVQLPQSVQLACLSATVSNAEELGAWLAEVREGCDVVITDLRPVPLEHHWFVGDRLYPMFAVGGKQSGRRPKEDEVAAARQARAGRPNPEVLMLERQANQRVRNPRTGRSMHVGPRLRAPRRGETVRELQRRGWLPAIYFLFSRQGCDDAVQQLVADGVRLTTPPEQQAIRRIVDERTADLGARDLEVLGFGPWASALELGIAAHHAGMVPPFKEAVEELFVRGLLRVCFATETLALGINMPARSVVVERLEKWTGTNHALLTPGQFTQLTGRAGRRGLDPVGHAVVLHQRDVPFEQVAGLVARRVEPLRSSFAPSYNMAVNLLRTRTLAEAEGMLERSFAQYQADLASSGEADQIARNRDALEGYAANLHSDLGNFGEYWALRRELSRLEGAGARDRKQRRAAAAGDGLAALRPGDVIELPGERRRPVLAAVVSRSQTKEGAPLAYLITSDRRHLRVGAREFAAEAPAVVGFVALPNDGSPRQPRFRQQVQRLLQDVQPRRRTDASGEDAGAPDRAVAAEVASLRARLQAHPVHSDPELPELELWARRHDDLRRRTESLERGVRHRTRSLVGKLDRIVRLLQDLGYLDDRPSPTEAGRGLGGLYAETDLVLAEVLRAGLLEPLDAAELAAAASVFTYQSRGRDDGPPRIPSGRIRTLVEEAGATWLRVAGLEEAAGLPVTRELDAGFVDPVLRWARGFDLDDVLDDSDLTPGDFVRQVKQVADLLRQLRDVAGGTLGDRASAAVRAITRGVVAAAA